MDARRRNAGGQALAEFALIFPIAMLVIVGIIVLGMYVFFQQQVTNVAREAARFAAIHSSTALCPTVGWRDPQAPPTTYPRPIKCDGPTGWPKLTMYARNHAFGLPPNAVWVNACWSGYAPAGTTIGSPPNYSAASGFPLSDDPPVGALGPGVFAQCTINRIDPITNAGALGCSGGMTTAADDPASSKPGNQVTMYACFQWSPPLAGLLMVPNSVTMRAVITEVIQTQQ